MARCLTGAAQGLLFGPGAAISWWEKQAFGGQAVTHCDVMVSGHYHAYGAGVAVLPGTRRISPPDNDQSTRCATASQCSAARPPSRCRSTLRPCQACEMTWTYATTGPFGSATTTARRNSVRRLIGDTATATQLLSDEEIKFTLDQSDVQTPNSAVIRVYNLAPDTAKRVQSEFSRVVLNAGYEHGAFGVVFDGTSRMS